MTFRNRLRENLYLLPPILLLLVGVIGFGRAIFNVIPPITPYLMEYLKRFIALPAIAAIAALVWWIFLIRRDKSRLHKVFMGISIAVVVGLGISVGMWALYQRNCVANLQPLQDYYNCNFFHGFFLLLDLSFYSKEFKNFLYIFICQKKVSVNQ